MTYLLDNLLDKCFLDKLPYQFKQSDLLARALTHKSFANENPGNGSGHNERLEFLGDAVLDLAMSDVLFTEFPQMAEGDLSKLRASLVNETSLSELAVALGVDQALRLGKGETKSGGALKPRLLASALEAIIGAVHLESGYDASYGLVVALYKDSIEQVDHNNHFIADYKTRFQEKAQEVFKATPHYQVTDEAGPDHDKVFFVQVFVGEKLMASGQGKNKKAAEQDAAKSALEEVK